MSKTTKLQAQLERAAGRRAPVAVLRTAGAPSREGKIHIGAYLAPEFKTSLRLVQAKTGQDLQALLSQALNELFRAHDVAVVE